MATSNNQCWLDFCLTRSVAKQCVVGIDAVKATRFTSDQMLSTSALYAVNQDMQLYQITRSIRPRKTLSYEQVAMLAITPKEARTELLQSFLSPSDS